MKTIVVAAVVSLVVSLLATPLFIRLLRRKGYGQPIRVDGPKTHATKRGTPTMGGVVFLLAAIIGYVAAHLGTDEPFTASGLLVLLMMTGLGLVGFADDCLKIFRQTSLGLRSGTKIAGQVLVAVAFGVAVLHFPNGFDLTPADARLSFLRDFGPALGMLPFVFWVVLVCVGTSNAVNLTDGLDGLASGATIAVLAAYLVIGVWQERHSCASVLATGCYQVRDPLDLAVVAAAVLGGCAGYLWWNAPPAKIFMGDTGSLALGGGLAGLAICTKTQLLLAILGGLFVAVTMSDVIQVGCYKLTGKRVFKMAPLQHHFEILGWAEMTIVVRFWMVSWLCSGLGLSIFYLTWAATGYR